jgi:thioredoxin-related protein
MRIEVLLSVLALMIAGGLGVPPIGAAEPDPAAKPARPVLYDEKADGAQQVATALRAAKTGKQRVLLMFGANWCGWCHKLHRTFREEAAVATRLKESYQLVLIDMNRDHNAAVSRQYGRPDNEGVPYLIVLDADGKVVARQETGALEVGDHHDPAKVLAFLDRWKP